MNLTTLFRILPVSLLAMCLLTACDDETNSNEYQAQVVEVELPETAQVNTLITFTIRFAAHNGCQYYSRNRTIINGKKVTVTLFAIDASDNRGCTQAATPVSVDYTFTPSERGIYTFRFSTGTGYITDTINVY